MAILVMIIHIIVCFFLITIVLLQGGKGAELGAAVAFMITSLTLAVITAKRGSVVKAPPVSEEKGSVPSVPGPIQAPSQSQTPQPPAQPSTK
jgi:preprotein translocase subunit SecG